MATEYHPQGLGTVQTADPGSVQGMSSHAHQLDETHINWKRLGERVFGLVKALNNLLKCLVLCDQLIRCLWPNPTNCSAVVTSTQDTDVDELLLQSLSCYSNDSAQSGFAALSLYQIHVVFLQVPVRTKPHRCEDASLLAMWFS